jgi:hypothetical protein
MFRSLKYCIFTGKSWFVCMEWVIVVGRSVIIIIVTYWKA